MPNQPVVATRYGRRLWPQAALAHFAHCGQSLLQRRYMQLEGLQSLSDTAQLRLSAVTC
jgi:hypothetical protein